MPWHHYENSQTVGEKGAEDGVIILDEAHNDGARITIERGGSVAPWSITCGISGWTAHTRFFPTESQARSECEEMKVAIAAILEAISQSAPSDSSHVVNLIEHFIEQFP